MRLLCPLAAQAGLLASRIPPSEPSVSNHRPAPMVALTPNPSAPWASPPLGKVWASPLGRRLARRYGRIEFVILRMAPSPPVAPHPASRRRSYVRLQAGVGIPGEDFHLPDRMRSQAHDPGLRRGDSKFAALGRFNRDFFTSAIAGMTGQRSLSAGREARTQRPAQTKR